MKTYVHATGTDSMENSMEFPLKNLKIKLPYDLAILPLDIYPREMTMGFHRGIYTLMFMAVLLTLTKVWNSRWNIHQQMNK